MLTVTVVTLVPPTLELIGLAFAHTLVLWLEKLEVIPGGSVVVHYIKKSHQNDPGRTVFEVALFLLLVYYIVGSRTKELKLDTINFSKKEMEELVEEWQPQPLVDAVTDLENWKLHAVPVIHGHNAAHVQLELGEVHVANLATNDFLNLNELEPIKLAAQECIKLVGVGACGPPNFYGTQDVHVRLEEDLARFLETDLAILYGQDYVTLGSVISSFVKRGDLLVVDLGINLSIQKAIVVSRADIEWFDHNDMDHLEKVLTELQPVLAKQKPLRRRVIVTEGLFANTGEVPNLKRIVELKNKFKYRLFLDESLSVGVLGDHGRGLPEHAGVPRSEVDLTVGSMACALASLGGFCVGEQVMVHHQRIALAAYVFSASLPPYLAKVVSQAIHEIGGVVDGEDKSILLGDLRSKLDFVYSGLSQASLNSVYFEVVSSPVSPAVHIKLHDDWRRQLNFPIAYGNDVFLRTGKIAKFLNSFDEYYNSEQYIMQRVVDYVLENTNVLVTRSKLILEHENLPVGSPHLIINVKRGVSDAEYAKLVAAVPMAFSHVCGPLQTEADLLVLNEEIRRY